MNIVFQDNLTTIYQGDNIDIVPFIRDKYDCVITDPPYGVNIGKRKWHGNNGKTRISGFNEWDSLAPNFIHEIIKDKIAIVWGGNFFGFAPSKCWFVWDKLQSNYGADCELAWTNLDKPTKVFRMSRIDAYVNKKVFKKEHPAEKPFQLMEWCLGFLPKVKMILDPYMGCGSTIIAARKNNIQCIGIEKEEQYVKVAIDRIKNYKKE